MKKSIVLLLSLCMSFCLLTGCTSKFDAGAYVESVLDLTTKGETKEYMEITDSTKKEAKKLYYDQIGNEMSSLGLDGESVLTEEMQDQYKTLFQDLLATAKYKVGEVTEKDGDYTVKLTVSQAMITKDLSSKFDEQLNAYQEELTKSISEGGTVPSDAEMTEKVYQIMYDLLNTNIANVTYGDEQSIDVHVVQKDGVYSIPDDDYQVMEKALYNMDEFQMSE